MLAIYPPTADQAAESIYQQQVQDFTAADSQQRPSLQFALHYPYRQYYLDDTGELVLYAIFHLQRQGSCIDSYCTIIRASASSKQQLVQLDGSLQQLQQLAVIYNAPLLNLQQPILLEPLKIAKPWGSEIWYTGIERRGQSKVSLDLNLQSSMPLPWLLDLLPQTLCANLNRQLILLKILDPLADEVFGDLYFEMHQRKQEVYVVTHIDPQAWPEGVGQIRFGFCAQKIQQYSDLKAFKNAFVKVAAQYEKTRARIDRLLDQKKQHLHIPTNQPVAVKLMQQWLLEIPAGLTTIEQQQRRELNSFTGHKSLRVGDVLKIPCFTPHSLLHGVRCIEFQTPVYERMILSFGQKVLTQQHWDTAKAMQMVNCDVQHSEAAHCLLQTEQLCIDVVVNYPQFTVHRYKLQANAKTLLKPSDNYRLLIIITGNVQLNRQLLTAEQACLLPANMAEQVLHNTSTQEAILLLAMPVSANT
ncbi:MAG: hypothetical protein OFPI_41660 [Osedax symbiont Rs2]|nr:MAG: hypothetical protein OFPI_41660 [Osedax symbiont Rs2]